jgi:hypothetical protein
VTGNLTTVNVQYLARDERRRLQEQDAVHHVVDLPATVVALVLLVGCGGASQVTRSSLTSRIGAWSVLDQSQFDGACLAQDAVRANQGVSGQPGIGNPGACVCALQRAEDQFPDEVAADPFVTQLYQECDY